MKKILYCILTIVISALSYSSCNTEDTTWQKDCGAFVNTLTEQASKASGKNTKGYDDRFVNKEVRWELNFKEIKKNNNGEESLEFDLERFGLLNKFFSGKPIMMSFEPATGALEAFRNIKPGSLVKVSATVTHVSFMTMSPGDDPDRKIQGALVTIGNVKIIRD